MAAGGHRRECGAQRLGRDLTPVEADRLGAECRRPEVVVLDALQREELGQPVARAAHERSGSARLVMAPLISQAEWLNQLPDATVSWPRPSEKGHAHGSARRA